MANCPNCGSSDIQIRRETNVSWGRAVAGWALFGAVGAAVGAVTGEDRNVNACLDCGTAWKAADLYKTRLVIKDLTGATLDLAREYDRRYMNAFMQEVGPYIAAISDVEKKATKHLAKQLEHAKNKLKESASAGFNVGIIVSLFAFAGIVNLIISTGLTWLLILVILPPILGFYLGSRVDRANKLKQETVEREIERAKMEADQLKFDAEEDLRRKLAEFQRDYPYPR